MQKYGFIYLWYDKKRKMYYIGSHWGTINDRYICSSNRMRDAYRRRSEDFKRRILKKIYTNRKDLLEEEFKWLSLIKNEELNKKYYNIRKHRWGHWSTDINNRKTISEKISDHHKNYPNWGQWNKGKKVSEKTKKILSEIALEQWKTEESRQILVIKSKELWKNPEYRKINTENKIDKKQSQETLDKRKETKERTGRKGGPKKGAASWNKGKKLYHLRETHWYTNGTINIKRKECPEGFWPGKTHKKKIKEIMI